MNATSLYVSTCRLILQAKSDDPSTWTDLFKVFPCLRQSLSCTVCENLLTEPYTPIESTCQHHVCRSCKGGKKKLKPSCSWCKDYEKYVENVQLRCLLQCFKKLCEYLMCCNIYGTISALPGSSSMNSLNSLSSGLIDIIKEGSGIRDDFKAEPELYSNNINSFKAPRRSTSTQTISSNQQIKQEEEITPQNRSIKQEEGPSFSIECSDVEGQPTIKRTERCTKSKINVNGNGSSDLSVKKEFSTKVNKVRKRSVFTTPPTCRCGVVTKCKGCCRGYRCPCYSADKSCLDCGCIGCKNPRGASLNKGNPDETGQSSKEDHNSLQKNNSDMI